MNTLQFIFTTVAVLISPLIAVQVTEWLRKREDARNRRLWIFKTLMATRGSQLAAEHVGALNAIDIEFHGKDRKTRDVLDAWKMYLEHLRNYDKNTYAVWTSRKDDLFFDLLHKISIVVGYDLEKTDIRRTSYVPHAHFEAETEGQIIRKALAFILSSPVILDKLQLKGVPPELTSAVNGAESSARLSIEQEQALPKKVTEGEPEK